MKRNKPAILGGKPEIELDYTILKYRPSKSEVRALCKNIQKGNLSQRAVSEQRVSLVDKFKEYHGRKFAIPFANCTSALFTGYIIAGFREGDEIIVPAYSYHAAVLPIVYTNAKPIFCDVEEQSLSLDPMRVMEKVNDRTKGLVVTNMWGVPAQLSRLRKICNERGIIMIEDAARGIGGETDGNKIGSFADIAAFSFSYGKAISTGEGGMLITHSEEFYSRAISVGHPAYRGDFDSAYDLFFETAMGTNHLMHPLATYMANIQFDALDTRRNKSNENWSKFKRMLDEFEFIQTLSTPPNAIRGAWSGISFLYDAKPIRLEIDLFVKALKAERCRIKREYESNIMYGGDAIKHVEMLISDKRYSLQPKKDFPITEKIRNSLLICEGMCSYLSDVDEFVDGYRRSIKKVIENVQLIRGAK